MLQAMILRSPHAHAKILSVDPSDALKNPNVMAVITPDDVKQLTKPFKPGRYAAGLKRPIDEYAGAVEKVRYVGEPIGAWRRAIAARRKTPRVDQVDYEPLRAVVDVREAIKPIVGQRCSMNWARTWPGRVAAVRRHRGGVQIRRSRRQGKSQNPPLQLDAARTVCRDCIL